jgi:hypothetical protein
MNQQLNSFFLNENNVVSFENKLNKLYFGYKNSRDNALKRTILRVSKVDKGDRNAEILHSGHLRSYIGDDRFTILYR